MPFSKEIIGVLVLALLGAGAYAWRVESRLESAQEDVGRLEAENGQLTSELTDSEAENGQLRTEMQLWRDLYGQLQSDFKTVRDARERANRELAELRRQPDVEEFESCPMPDGVYQWLRDN